MMRAIIGVLVISLGILLKSCNTVDPPPGDKPTLALKLEDVSCTEAWIQLTTNNLQLPTTVTLKQTNPTGDTKSHILNLNTKDSLLYVDSLLPNQTYKFHTTIQSSSHTSNELNVTTMDTTSHDFTFESWTFGTIGSSTLYDVAIISPENIWCVGEINIADTSINGYTTYNAVHWDGSQWELKRILYQGGYWVIRTIFAFSENDIWFSAFVRYDGQNFIELPIPPILIGWSINKIWGSSSSDLYAVGNDGNITFYNGSQWTKIESGTELNINDIWGDYNEKTGESEILAVASNKFFNEGKTILKIDGLFATEINVVGLPWSLSSVWFRSEKKYYVGGDGLYFKRLLSDTWVKDGTFITIYKDRIRGADINDIIISGSNGLLSHYNGIYWYHYINNELPYYSGRLLSCEIKNNIIVAVGWKEIQAIITMGKR
jgi:hypothetical protein